MRSRLLGWGVALAALTTTALAQEPRPRRPGALLIGLDERVPAAARERLQAALARRQARAVRHLNGPAVVQLELDLAGQTEEEVADELARTGAVRFAEPDYACPPDETVPNDPRFPEQWWHAKLRSSLAWDLSTGSAQVLVGVCDTGADVTHPDLAPNLLLPGFNSVDNSQDVADVHGHGTKTSGCVAAVGNNGVGVAGLGWSTRVLPIKISNSSDGYAYYSDMAEGIQHAVDRGAKVVNLSYGGYQSATIQSVGNWAYDRGALLCVSAGNSALDVSGWPDNPKIALVGASTSSDARASFSNYGAAVDWFAPGAGVLTTSPGGYASVSGTSFSAPISAGLAALVFAVRPKATPAAVLDAIQRGCVDLGEAGEDAVFGFGRVDARRTLELALSGANEPPLALALATPQTGPAPLQVALDGSGSRDPDGSVVRWSWTLGDGTSATGAKVEQLFSQPGSYTVKLTVTDALGATGEAALTIVVLAPDTSPPPAPSLLSPAAGATTADATPTFSWSAVMDASGVADYELQVDDDPAFASPALSVRLAGTNHTPGTPLPPSAWRWRVRARDSVGNVGPWSETRAFSLVAASAAVSVASIDYALVEAKRSSRLEVTARVVDGGGAPVPGATVLLELRRNGSPVLVGQATTGADGRATVSLSGAKRGSYVTIVQELTAAGLAWDGVTPPNAFSK